MVNIILIFAIAFVCYCEINAEILNIQSKVTTTADFKSSLIEKKNDAGIGSLGRRAQKGGKSQTNRYTNGSQEDNSLNSEFVQSNSEALYNYFKPGVVDRRRFSIFGEIDQTDKKPQSLMKQPHHLNDKKKEIHKKDIRVITENNKRGNAGKHIGQIKRFQIADRDKKSNVDKHKGGLINLRIGNYNIRENIQIQENPRVKEKTKDKHKKKGTDRDKETVEKKRTIKMVDSGSKKYTHEQKETKKNNNDALKTVKSSPANLGKPSQAIIKDPKLKKKENTAMKSEKTKPKKAQTMSEKPKKTGQGQVPVLRSHKSNREAGTRSTKMSPLSQDMDKKGNKPWNSIDKIEMTPSNLSPYAIVAQMEQLMSEFPDAISTIVKPARTVEYNDIILVTIKEKEKEKTFFRARESKYVDDVPEKKIIFLVHGLTVMGLKGMKSLTEMSELKLLLSYYFKHLDKFDFYLMPLANPDGYFATSDSVLWNKNVSPQDMCTGVFVDRNFDVSFNDTHAISPCSMLYPGPTAFSEEESKAVRDVFHQYGHKILAYIHVHAGTFDDQVFKGDAILYPRGYTEMQSDDDKYIDLKGEIDEAMKNASFRVMSVTVDTLANWYGVVRGTSVDYAATVYGIPYAMEFVMQIYNTEELINSALTEIWSRLIDTTFNNMWKSLQRGSDVRRK